ncbi:MAG TPA: serine hydrolase domain-containing protein [Holophaga sp.]|nr:serine hydrolase domain-containing protein [Holophaga sp.]
MSCFNRIWFCLVVLTAALGGTPARSRDLGPVAEALRTLAQAHSEAHDQAGIALAVVDGGGKVWPAACGLADRERGLPAGSATLFELGSISKIFTCIAVMQLREQGKVDLDRPYLSYVPEFSVQSAFPGGAGAITVRMLMTHMSGLVADDDAWETTHPARDFHRAVLEHVKDSQLLYEPGRRWHYSSFGTSLLGVLVECLSGLAFADYMQRNVLQPMGMASASFDLRGMDQGSLSAGYHHDPAYDLIPKDEIRPGGSLRASIEESAKLMAFLAGRGAVAGHAILQPGSLDEMLRLQNPGCAEQPMGLGFRIHPQGGNGQAGWVYHDGTSRNRSFFMFVPAWNTGFIVVVNDFRGCDLFLWELKEAFLEAMAAA